MSDKLPLISVIVPVYNVGVFLAPCLDSLLAQTYKNLEILLIDDGSTDGSGKICDDYAEKDPRFKVVHKENGGVSSARNLGLDIAKGEYIAFVDSDDRLLPDYFEVLYRDLDEQNVDAAFCGFLRIDENGKALPSPAGARFHERICARDLFSLFSHGHKIRSACCALFSAATLREQRFSDLRFGEDSLFVFQWLCTNPSITGIPYQGYLYLQRETSATNTSSIPKLARATDHLTLYSYLFLNLPIKEPAIQKRYINMYAEAIHKTALFACLSDQDDVQALLEPHLTNTLPHKRLLSPKFRVLLVLLDRFPWFYRQLILLKHKLKA